MPPNHEIDEFVELDAGVEIARLEVAALQIGLALRQLGDFLLPLLGGKLLALQNRVDIFDRELAGAFHELVGHVPLVFEVVQVLGGDIAAIDASDGVAIPLVEDFEQPLAEVAADAGAQDERDHR